jgi:NAD-dependent DNA ligase (contains BRCT domain type II)
VFFYLTCGAENIGEETLSRLFNAGYNSINAMLNITFNQLLEIEGFGEGMANVIIDNNKMIRAGIPLPTLMHASDQFPGIGAIKAQQILDGLDGKVEDALYNGEPVSELLPPEEEIANMPVTLQNFWNNLTKFQRFVELNGLVIRRATVVTVDMNGKYKDMTVCFSGVRNPELETAIIKGGGKVASGVSKKTTHLVVKDKNANSAKILKSKELGIPILTMDEFLSF